MINLICSDSYKVYLMKQANLSTHGECMLSVASDKVRLLDCSSQRELVSWPFKALRRYGVERNMFTLEAGRYSIW